MSSFWRRRVIVAAAAGLTGGFIVRGFLPPFILDDPFWRDFLSGPPVAGLFAVLGAGIAYAAARISDRTAKRAAERQEWWDRTEWALGLVVSDLGRERDAGLAAVEVLLVEATTTEAAMINAVTEAFLPPPGDVDTGLEPGAE